MRLVTKHMSIAVSVLNWRFAVRCNFDAARKRNTQQWATAYSFIYASCQKNLPIDNLH